MNIAVFKDRVEIRSPGGLFGGLTIEQITKENVSKRRNELVADIFHRVHFVEKWGRGIELILTREPTATFKVVADIFITTFKRRDYMAEEEAKLVEGLGEKLGERLGENQKLILKLMNEDSLITIPKIAQRIGISTTAVENNIAKLKKKGILRRVGPAKGGYWEIIK